MLKVYMIEWWDEECKQYRKEYYRILQRACDRFTLLSDVKTNSNPEISTVFVA